MTAVRANDVARSYLLTPEHGETEYTIHRLTDCRTALVRGLVEYLEDLSGIDWSGRSTALASVADNHAEYERAARYPAAVVWAQGDGEYDAANLSPGVERNAKLVDGRRITVPAEHVVNLVLEVDANDPVLRQGVAAMLEDALTPVVGRSGFLLVLPHYHHARASYLLLRAAYVDADEEAKRQLWRVRFALRARVPQIRLYALGEIDPRSVQHQVTAGPLDPPAPGVRSVSRGRV